MADTRIVVTGMPMLPDRTRLLALMDEAIAAGVLTNGGVLHGRFEEALAGLTSGCHVALTSSGTMALMLALRLGNLPEGAEVITSPLSFPATVQAIAWCGFRPVFADVEAETLTLCPRAVEAAMTPRTAAILPVHLLGVPCDVDALANVARRHGVWLVYDAAHAFGVALDGRSIAQHGNASAFSLHATKLLHTGEGGFVAVAGHDAAERLRHMRNFGLEAGRMTGPGINGKLSEMQAAVGLALLPDLSAEIAARQALRARYDAALAGIAGLTPQPTRPGASDSLSFYAVRTAAPMRARVVRALIESGIHPRDHFPLLCGPRTPYPTSSIVTAGGKPVAPVVGQELFCLPFHGQITPEHTERIMAVLARGTFDEAMAP